MKLQTKVDLIIFKERVLKKTSIYWEIIKKKIIEERQIILKVLKIFVIFLVALQFSRFLDSFQLYSRDRELFVDLEKKFNECENDNIRYKSAIETFSKRLKIPIEDLYRK
jgi:hypothetical protein